MFPSHDPWLEKDNEDGPMDAVWLDDPIWEQGELGDLDDLMIEIARMDGGDIPQYIEQERGNKVATHHYEKLLANSEVHGDRVTGKKQARAKPLVGLAEKGLIFVVRSSNDAKVRQAFQSFTPDGAGKFKDIIDAASGGYGAYLEHEWPPEFVMVM